MLSKKVKIILDSNQELIINTLSNEHRLLYNYLLENIKVKLDFKYLNQCYKTFRHTNKLTISSKSAQNTCIGLINNIKSYLTLKKKDKTAKFPYKFKGYKYFTSFTYDSNGGKGGFKIENNQIIFNLLSSAKSAKKLTIDLPKYCDDINQNNIKTVTIKKEDDNYYIIFTYQEDKKNYNLNKENYLGIDLGYSVLVNGVTKDENIKINNLKQKKLHNKIEEIQGLKDNKVKGSRKYKQLNKSFKRNKKKQVNQLKDFQHKVSKKVVDYCIENDIGTIIIGDLKVKKVNNKNNRKISGQSKLTSIGRFKTLLEYKSNNVDIEYKLINEYNTSKINCLTGKLDFDSSVKNREFIFDNMNIDRDINSCVNIITKSGLWLTQDQKIDLLNNKINFII